MQITDVGLAHLAGLTKLRQLNLDRLAIGDAGIARLHRLQELRELSIRDTHITGDGLRVLVNYPHLESLHLSGLLIDNAVIEHVAQCKRLTQLSLRSTRVTDDGFRRLAELTELKRLFVDSHFLTDAAPAHLAGLKKLEFLRLRSPHMTDKSLKLIAQITSLTALDLSGQQRVYGDRVDDSPGGKFTVAGFAELAQLPNLRSLGIPETDLQTIDFDRLGQLDIVILAVPNFTLADMRRLENLVPKLHSASSSSEDGVMYVFALYLRDRRDAAAPR